MKATVIFFLLSIALLVSARSARANEDDELIKQVIAQASKNSDATIAGQVRQYVVEHRDTILAIIRSYRSYLNQALASATDDESAGAANIRANAAQVNRASSRVRVAQTSAGGLQLGRLQTGSLQPSGKLQGAHLDGYPALPDVAPASSIVHPTAAQLAHGRQIDEAIRERKRFHMQHPARYER